MGRFFLFDYLCCDWFVERPHDSKLTAGVAPGSQAMVAVAAVDVGDAAAGRETTQSLHLVHYGKESAGRAAEAAAEEVVVLESPASWHEAAVIALAELNRRTCDRWLPVCR